MAIDIVMLPHKQEMAFSLAINDLWLNVSWSKADALKATNVCFTLMPCSRRSKMNWSSSSLMELSCLPVVDSLLCPDARTQPLDLLASLWQKWEWHAKNLTSSAGGGILLQPEPAADLLDNCIMLVNLASCPPWRTEEMETRYQEGKRFFD